MSTKKRAGEGGAAAGDNAFVARLREAWGRPELTAGERASFDARLQARLEEHAHGREWVRLSPRLALSASLVGAAVLALWVGARGSGREGSALVAADAGAVPSVELRAETARAGDLVAVLIDAEESVGNSVSAYDADGGNAVASDAETNLWRVQTDGGLREHLPAEYRALAMWVAVPEPDGDARP